MSFCTKRILALAPAALALLLAACSGGAPTTTNPNSTVAAAGEYAGPSPTNADVQAFKVNLWDNIRASNRCGNCHKANGQAPEFARSDDVNQAYTAALQVVNLTEPDQSMMVVKVGGGHNCWLASNQACADILTTWIKNWAGGSAAGATQIELTAPADHSVGSTKSFPADTSAFVSSGIYGLLTAHCSRCHSSTALTPQNPFFASSDVNEAYANAQAKINIDVPENSRFYVRLKDEFHNCWYTPVSCDQSAADMLTAIQNFVGAIPTTAVDPSLVLSQALSLYEGTIASGQNRYDAGMIAKYQFKTTDPAGSALDTSGVDPAADLTLTGDVSKYGGWGVQFGPNGGKAYSLSSGSGKLTSMIKNTGEYSIELWAAPANVAQEDAWLAALAGSPTTVNFALSQKAYQYEMFNRSSSTGADGNPSLLTNDDDQDAQATLQHIVLTFDPTNGRRLYVNGNFTGDVDAQKGGDLSSWDSTFQFLLGNDPSSMRKWQGVIRFAQVYDKALTLSQVQQNFAAGVGERYFLLFNVSALTGVNKAYVMFQVSTYDSYSYLFSRPVFISLDPAAQPGSIEIQGMRIGINGKEAKVGQAYSPLDVTVTNAAYSSTNGQLLSPVGTVIALEKGPNSDMFFLSFDRIGTMTHVRTEPTPVAAPDTSVVESPDVGVRVFSELNASMSAITGVPVGNADVLATYNLVEQQLPSVTDIQAVLASHQVGIAQLAIQYCDSMVETPSLAASFFPGVSFTATPSTAFGSGNASLINPLMANIVGSNLASQPTAAQVNTEINNLVTTLTSSCGSGCDATRTKTIAKATCAAVLGSAAVLIK
ncbi:MAG TPA: LamG-like jellyroll fold domain-containing protein [Steroidobacteraceae bacterium]|nr:LamG-like jellyroll fold domain-containing protein [Steroidobacteraceae bacterium]